MLSYPDTIAVMTALPVPYTVLARNSCIPLAQTPIKLDTATQADMRCGWQRGFTAAFPLFAHYPAMTGLPSLLLPNAWRAGRTLPLPRLPPPLFAMDTLVVPVNEVEKGRLKTCRRYGAALPELPDLLPDARPSDGRRGQTCSLSIPIA